MPRKTPIIEVEEISGDQFTDIDSAWRAALPTFAGDLAATIRRLVAEGYFILKDGKLIRNPERQRINEKEIAA